MIRTPTFLALLFLSLVSCTTTEPVTEVEKPAAPALAAGFAGGIPFGLYALPVGQIGSVYNGMHRNARVLDSTGTFMSTLSAVKSRGGKISLNMAGNPNHYRDANWHFSFTKWKARVDTFRKYNFSSYITDGTLFAHFLIDEPNDKSNWGGVPVTGTQIEAMAAYSKSIWPNLPTVVRTESTYLLSWPGYKSLDATWAQYVYRKGDPKAFIDRNVADAQKLGLALVTGLNIKRGGPNGATMTPTQIKSWGSTLLTSTYPCAFISWEYVSSYYSKTAVRDAMAYLRGKAQNRATKRCT
jgi:hypothetical protein